MEITIINPEVIISIQNPNNNYSSRNVNAQQRFKVQNKPNIGGLERNTRGKYNSQVVKGAMFAIQKQIPYGRKRHTKDFQAAPHVEDLAANFATWQQILPGLKI